MSTSIKGVFQGPWKRDDAQPHSSRCADADAGDVLSVSVLGTCALYAAQSMLVFGFAAAALEAAFSNALVRRMGGSAR
jgi:hypothetical protein